MRRTVHRLVPEDIITHTKEDPHCSGVKSHPQIKIHYTKQGAN